MKKLLFVLGILAVCGMFAAFRPVAGPFEDVVSALKQGDAGTLSKHLDNTVEINMTGKSHSYSRAQAEIILKDFFGKNAVKSFDVIHRGGQEGGSQFGVGSMVTSGGNYRISFFLQKKSGVFVLNELRFENK
ncbi:DUF4783 domain-containing protein [Chitinophaga lutea]